MSDLEQQIEQQTVSDELQRVTEAYVLLEAVRSPYTKPVLKRLQRMVRELKHQQKGAQT